jgi:RimJ/RimL family protein N-acetyltransferase
LSKTKDALVDLRPLNASHAAPLFAAAESSRAQLKRRFGWTEQLKAQADCGAFIRGTEAARGVFELETGVLVGVAALEDSGELSIWIAAPRCDRGYATEAARALIERGFKGGRHRVWCRIEPSNRAARKVLQKLGFKYEGCLRKEKRLNGRWIDQECWGLLKEEWGR